MEAVHSPSTDHDGEAGCCFGLVAFILCGSIIYGGYFYFFLYYYYYYYYYYLTFTRTLLLFTRHIITK